MPFQKKSENLLKAIVYIDSHPRINCFATSHFFSVVRHVRSSKLGSKPGWLIHQPKIQPHSHEETSVSIGILNAYVSLFFCLHISA